MCGLFGWCNPSWPDSAKKVTLLKHLARKNQSRGSQSFGLALATNEGMKAFKFVGPASQWLEKNDKKLGEIARSPIIMGHTRWPSMGRVSLANVHPFAVGEYYIAHNGTISNSGTLMNSAKFVAKGETDSEETACFLASEGFTKEAFNKINGSWAFTIAKLDGSEFILAVDRVATFHVAWFDNGCVWSSEEVVLKSSLEAAGIRCDVSALKCALIHLPSMSCEEVDVVGVVGPAS